MPHLQASQRPSAAHRDATAMESQFGVISVSPSETIEQMSQAVVNGLSQRPQKTLPCAYFYDETGSQLYEEITTLPEYYLTRTETAILRQAVADVWRLTKTTLGEPPEIVELGSGSSSKTRIILNEWQRAKQPMTYLPIDVNESLLHSTGQALTQDYQQLNILGLAGCYQEALSFLPRQRERLFLFLGSSIGNFSPEAQDEFMRLLLSTMGPQSRLLLGYDRQPHAQKPIHVIEAAYNDTQGVTAAFNLNLLDHINHKLGGNFKLDQWKHQAHYNPVAGQMELFLESLCDQSVYLGIPERAFQFAAKETILTEISRKFDPVAFTDSLEAVGFQTLKHWQDSAGLYGLLLLQA